MAARSTSTANRKTREPKLEKGKAKRQNFAAKWKTTKAESKNHKAKNKILMSNAVRLAQFADNFVLYVISLV